MVTKKVEPDIVFEIKGKWKTVVMYIRFYI